MNIKIVKSTAVLICISILLTSCNNKAAEKDISDTVTCTSSVTSSETTNDSANANTISQTDKSNVSANYSSTASNNDKKVPENNSSDIPKNDNNIKNDYNIKIVRQYSDPCPYIETDNKFEYQSFYDSRSGLTMPYRLHLPVGYSPQKKYPVILFLHGLGEIGDDNDRQLSNFIQCFNAANDILRDAIIVCPQTPSGWNVDFYEPNDRNGYLCIAKRILDNVIKKYNGDINRIYLTGLSLGGFATWHMLECYPDFFAAAVPVCGGVGYYAPQVFIDTPIWIYHGTADDTVPFSSSNDTYNAIIDAGGNKIRFTRLDGVGHNAWYYAYRDREMFSWMFSQNRKTHQSADYDYISVFEILTSGGKLILNERNIYDTICFFQDDAEYIELKIDDEASKNLKSEYAKNKNAVFSLRLFKSRIYDFSFISSPDDKCLYIKNSSNDERIDFISNLIQ